MLRRGVTASGTNEAANLGIWGEKSSEFRVCGVLYGGLAGGNTILGLCGAWFWRVAKFWLKFLTGIGFFSAPTDKDDILEISVKFRRKKNPWWQEASSCALLMVVRLPNATYTTEPWGFASRKKRQPSLSAHQKCPTGTSPLVHRHVRSGKHLLTASVSEYLSILTFYHKCQEFDHLSYSKN